MEGCPGNRPYCESGSEFKFQANTKTSAIAETYFRTAHLEQTSMI